MSSDSAQGCSSFRETVKVIWAGSPSAGGKWPFIVMCLACMGPKWGAQGITGEAGWME